MTRLDKVRVLLVDDSPMVRNILSRVLADQEGIEVVGGARDPFEARELIIRHRPHVIILDIEMPRMDGLTFLTKLMAHYPVPVIICSGVAPAASANAVKAIELGAIDVVPKPTEGGTRALKQLGAELADKIRAAAISKPPPVPVPPRAAPKSFRQAGIEPNRWVIAIGASTGGTDAIRHVLTQMPADAPPIVMVQHMPAGFTNSFARRLDEVCKLSVAEAEDNEILMPGRALLARGGVQMGVQSVGVQWRIRYGGTEKVNRHCPSVDYLFDSLTRCKGRRIAAVLLTGMGADGAKGLLHLREKGAITIAQDEASSVVYGMPKAAVELGAVQRQCPPSDVPRVLIELMGAEKAAAVR